MHAHRVIPFIHKAVGNDDTLLPVIIPANTSTSVCGSITTNMGEYVRLWIQNTGIGACYISLNNTCDLSNYDFLLPVNSPPLDLTPYGGAVSAFSITGTVATAVRLISQDINSNVSILPPPNQLNVPG